MEAPTIDANEAAATPPPKPESAPNQYSELVAELEKFGVKDTQQLQGKLAAAQQVGQMGNILGEVRKENEELKRFIKEQVNQQRQAPVQKRDEWGSPQPEAGAIDLQDLIKNTVRNEFRGALQEEKKQALMQQQKALEAYHKITGDADFHLVKDDWEAKLKDPNFALQFQSGQVDPVNEYQELLREKYKSSIRKSAEIIKSLTQGATPPKVHVEGQARIPGGKVEEPSDKDKILSPLREKVNKGKMLSEEEQLQALMKVLSSGG